MWEKRFNIVKKTTNKKIIAIIIYYFVLVIIGMINKQFGLIKFFNKDMFVLVFTFLTSFPLFWVLVTAKNYKIVGHLFMNENEIKIKLKTQNLNFPIKDVPQINFRFNGIYGENYLSSLLFGGIWTALSRDGAGNLLSILYDNKIYKINIALDEQEDLNALNFLFERIKKNNFTKIEIIDKTTFFSFF